MSENLPDWGRPGSPVMRLHRLNQAMRRAGCPVMGVGAVNRAKVERLKGLPNKRPMRGEVPMATAVYKVTRKRERDQLKYDGSDEQLTHRLIR